MLNHAFKAVLTGAAVASGLLAGLPTASAQVTVVASETFEYTYPGQLFDQDGGIGWSNSWYVGAGQDDISLFDSSVAPAFALDDGVGVYAGQVVPFGEAYRKPDSGPHGDISSGGVFGVDNTTMWFSFSTVAFAGMPQEHYGGLSLILQGCCEQLFIGSAWNTAQWGVDDEGPNGAPVESIAGTDDTVAARIVTRMDFLPGMDRVRVYLNPILPYPTGPADLDTMVHDILFDEIRLASGGNNGDAFYFDNIEVAKGVPMDGVGTNYCSPGVVNSTGQSAEIAGDGSNSVSLNMLTLEVSNLPPNGFGFLITSRTQALVSNPGGSQGTLCLGGAIGRYVGPGQVQNGGPAGAFSLQVDLTQIPQPNGFVSAIAGETWNYQAWYRDSSPSGATSNFTDGLSVLMAQ